MKWKTLFCLVLSLCCLRCDGLVDSAQIVSTDNEAQVLENGILYTLTVSETLFSFGDTLKFCFEVRNLSQSARQFLFPNIHQCGYELRDTNGAVMVYEPRIVQPATSEFTLAPNARKRFSFLCDFRNESGLFIASGYYRLDSALLFRSAPRVSVRIRIF